MITVRIKNIKRKFVKSPVCEITGSIKPPHFEVKNKCIWLWCLFYHKF